jgi:hypothetical protein
MRTFYADKQNSIIREGRKEKMILSEKSKLNVFRLTLLFSVIFIPVLLYSKDYYVKVSGSGTRAGDSWINAIDNKEFAKKLLTAVSGDIFHLAAGVYIPYFDVSGNENGNGRNKTFLIRDEVSVQGGYDADGNAIADSNSAISAVRLSGGQGKVGNNNSWHVVTIADNANSASTPTLHRLTVVNGYAAGWGDNSKGAGIFIGANAGKRKSIEISYVSVSDNQSNGDGCGIYASSNSNVVVRHSEITNNKRIASSDVRGGGVGIFRAQLTLGNSRITGNVANHGGAVHVDGGQLISDHSMYNNNSSGLHGGAIYIRNRSKAIFDSDTVAFNSSAKGGGIHAESRSEIQLKRSVLRGNTANEGGGFYNSGDCRTEADSCVIEQNKADRGGGIDNRGTMTLTRSSITANEANTDEAIGGGIVQRGFFTMNQCEISYNTAKNGAGIYVEDNNTQISNTTIGNNAATMDGGGMYHRFDRCELNFVTIAGNAANGTGGGIFGISSPEIHNSIISGNSRDDDFSGNNLYETGDRSSSNNIIGTHYYFKGNRSNRTDVNFVAGKYLAALAFNRGAATRTCALKWTSSPTENPAVGKADCNAGCDFDQTGFKRSKRYPSLGAYEENFFKASDDLAYADKAFIDIDVLANDSYPDNCNPEVILLTQSTSMAETILSVNQHIYYKPRSGMTGVDTLRYRIRCNAGGLDDSAKIAIHIGILYDTPQNIKEEVSCMEDMPAVSFKVHRRMSNEQVNVDGFSIPLVGDLNGDGKPEIIGLGVVADGGGKAAGLDAVGRSIVIYDGQTGDILLDFELATLGNNQYKDTKGYGTQFGFQLRWDPRHNSYSHLAIADLDNDGLGEIVVAETGSGLVYALKPVLDPAGNIRDLRKIWDVDVLHKEPYKVGKYRNEDAEEFGSPVPYISDLNGDGIPDIIAYNKIYNGRTGKLELELEELQQFADPLTNRDSYLKCRKSAYVGRLPSAENKDDCMPVIAINDVDNDGIMEIIAGSKIYKPIIVDANNKWKNTYSVTYGPESIVVKNEMIYLTDGFTVVADIDGDNQQDVIVVKRHKDRKHFVIYVWDPRVQGNAGLKAFLAVYHDADQGHFSVPFVGDVNGHLDGGYIRPNAKLPEICMTICKLQNTSDYPINNHPQSQIPDYTNGQYKGNDGSKLTFYGHVVAFTFDNNEPVLSKRLKLSWLMKHSDISHQTGLVMFDFDADGINELVYRDEFSLRVISPANRVNGLDYVHLGVTPETHPNVVRFSESGISSYTGFECPVVADVNGDGSADIITFALKSVSRVTNSSGHLFVYEADGESWAPTRPVWNQGIYYPLQINDDLTVPRRPQSTLTKYYSKLPAQPQGNIIQPFNGNWIQQPIVRKSNYVPILMTPDPSIRMEDIKIVSSSKSRTVIRLTVENRGKASVNKYAPLAFYHTSIAKTNRITTTYLNSEIYPGKKQQFEYTLTGDYQNRIIYVRLVDNGFGNFPASGYTDCDPSNNVASTMTAIANNDYYSLTANDLRHFNLCENDIFNSASKSQIEIIESARHGVALTVSDFEISYKPDDEFQGIDTLRYRLRCTYDNVTAVSEATVYILALKPVAKEYFACPKTSVQMEMTPIPGIEYSWFRNEAGGAVLPNGNNTNRFNAIKDAADETFWVQANARGFAKDVFPRFRVNILTAANCDKISECTENGRLLFLEDFGGNEYSKDNVAANSALNTVESYVYSTSYIDNSYTLCKVSGGKNGLPNNIDDHTYPNDIYRGYMQQFIATKAPGKFYRRQINDLCEGLTLSFSAWMVNLSANTKPSMTFEITDPGGNVLSRYFIDLEDTKSAWKNYGCLFTVPRNINSVVFNIVNNSSGSGSFAVDDIEVRLCVPKVTVSNMKTDTAVCTGQSLIFNGNYPGGGTLFDNDLVYRWEFRHVDSAEWTPLIESTGTPPLNISYPITSAGKINEGYYRFRVSKSEYIGITNCCGMSDSIRLNISEHVKFPDIRIQLSPSPERIVNLSSFLDSVSYTNIHWERLSSSPAIIAGTNETTGSIHSNDFIGKGTYTYIYKVASQCGSFTAKTYVRTLKDKVMHIPDTIMICGNDKLNKALNLNHLLGLELGGTWKYDNTVNPDMTVSDNVTVKTPPSKFAGSLIFDASNAQNTAPAIYSINYRGHNDAKIFKFIYYPIKEYVSTNHCELVVVVTN